jgi:hypothetical protein
MPRDLGKQAKAGAMVGLERAALAQAGYKQSAINGHLPNGNPNGRTNLDLSEAVGKIMLESQNEDI